MAVTTSAVIGAVSAAAGAVTSYQAGKKQKEDSKDAQGRAKAAEKREQLKAFGASQAKAASGYGSTLGAGSSSLGG